MMLYEDSSFIFCKHFIDSTYPNEPPTSTRSYLAKLIGDFLHKSFSGISISPLIAIGCYLVYADSVGIQLISLYLVTLCISVYVVHTMMGWQARGGINGAMVEESKRFSTSKPFLKRRVLVRPYHIDHIKRKVWQPNTSIEYVKQHGFCTVGTTLLQSLVDTITWSLEYKLACIARLFKLDIALHRVRSEKHSAEKTYLAIINTSMACFISSENGHFEVYDTYLPCHEGDIKKHFHKITLELDHVKRTCVCARIHILKSHTHKTVLRDSKEVGILASVIGAAKTHGHVHYFANGVSETEEYWPLAQKSSATVQALNYGAVFSVEPVFECSSNTVAEILSHNMITEGLPFHHHLSSLLGGRSLAHNMARAVRRRLVKMGLPMVHAECIVSATVLHSSDHYYFGLYIPKDCRSKFLKKDFTLLRNTLVAPISYTSKKMLCRQYPDYPICVAIYEECKAIDPDFAESFLFMTVAN